jgi:hypothetical protein
VVLSGAHADDALQALIRLQQELERRPLLSEDEKIACASAPVWCRRLEPRLDLMNRADQSLQHAQMTGSGGRLARG